MFSLLAFRETVCNSLQVPRYLLRAVKQPLPYPGNCARRRAGRSGLDSRTNATATGGEGVICAIFLTPHELPL